MNEIISKSPIGIFDSGIGGLTVYKEIKKILPNEEIIYLGDTARVPYGTKSEKTIKRYSFENTLFLIEYSIKLLVVACNTSTAYALSSLSSSMKFPVVGVIEPGAVAALKKTKNGRIGVIGTRATIDSGAYLLALKKHDRKIKAYSAACPLFVPLVEEGMIDTEITDLTVEKYLSPLLKYNIDAIILGCTHYPILKPAIKKFLGDKIEIVDSGEETARCVLEHLNKNKMRNPSKGSKTDRIIFTDTQRNIESIINLIFKDENQPKLDISFCSSELGKRT